MRSERIALITNGVWPYVVGGMQKHSYYLCKYLATCGISVDVYMPTSYEPATVNPFEKQELSFINFIPIPKPAAKRIPGHYLLESYEYSGNIDKELKRRINNYQLIYIQGLSGWKLLTSKKKGNNLPTVILNMHGLNMLQNALNFRSRIEQLLFRPIALKLLKKADYVQSLGKRLTDLLVSNGIKKEKIVEIGIGIEAHWLQNPSNKTYNRLRTFVFIGRFDRVKGIIELQEAIKLLISQYEFAFHFIGPIPLENRLIGNNIFYHNELKDESAIQAILDQSDFLVLPSHSEGMPTVILEAMARSCAIIATDVGAVAELVTESNGILIKPNSLAALLEAMEDAINMKKDRLSEMQTASKKIIKEKFVWNNLITFMIEKFHLIYAKP